MKFLQKLSVLCLLSGIFLLNACGGLTSSDKPAVTTWWLIPYTGEARLDYPETASPITLEVSVVPGLDTDQILTLSHDSELVPYSGAKWVDNLPELIGSLVSRTVEASGRFEVASSRASAASESCDLQLELQGFFAQLGSDGQTTGVQLAISGRYQCGSEAPTILQLQASVPVHDNRMKFIVAAFQQAMDSVMKDLLVELP
jgi:ABC-type uncharacterized transport system auxiliary subunit